MNTARAEIVVGVDGGGSGCRAAVADRSGKLLASVSGGPANVTTDPDLAARNVSEAIVAAWSAAGLDAAQMSEAVAHVGLAGVLTEGQSRFVAQRLPVARCDVTDDRPTSLAGALGDASGVLMAVGTGTFIAARHSGSVRGIGGWGLQVSDQASGAWLGRGLLECVLLCHDGMAEDTGLTRQTFARYGGEPGAIVAFARDAGPSDYAALAPSVIEAAARGDAVGAMLMQRGADYLNQALDVLGLGGNDGLCLTGGIGPHYADYLRPQHVRRIRPAEGTALDGALRLARKMLEMQEVR